MGHCIRIARHLGIGTIVCGLAALPAFALAQGLGGYGDYLDWEGWASVAPGEQAGLASSWDRSGGSYDANHYEFPPGLLYGNLDVIAARLTGPGIIYRFWMPHASAAQDFALRMYFDGESAPRIDTSSRELLDGTFSYFTTPLVTTFAGGQVCYEPIVFRDSLRIETENHANEWHWYQYTYRTFPPGTELTSYTGALDPAAAAARSATAAMFAATGEHPAGSSASAIRTETGPATVPPGGILTLADLTGPGFARRLCVRMDGATDAALDSLRLRVFYDGDLEPAIDAPVGTFYGAGHDRAPYRSLPMGTDSPDGFYCYWPMPFRAALRVSLANDSSVPIPIDSALIEHEPGPPRDDAGYLHTRVTETVVVRGQTHNVVASVQGAGHYVGNLLYIEQDGHDTHYFLEGDDIFVIDGVRTLNGTGLEDAYNGGFYYNWVPNPMPEPEGPSPPFAIRPLSGILRVARTADPPYGRADQYRWQIADRVPFSESFELSFETRYCWAGCQWISVVFWYQLPPGASAAPSRGKSTPGDLRLELRPGAPNPATDGTTIRFITPTEERVVLEILDVRGRRIETLVDERLGAGPHEIRWDAHDASGGVYFIRLRAGLFTESRKLVLVR